MQAWQIEATADGHVKWIPATVDRGRLRQPPLSEETLGCSMDDLLLDAWTRIQGEECASRKEEEEKLRGKEGQSTMFCTGLGRSVSMSRSSVEKAKAVMEVSRDEGHANRGAQFGTLRKRSERPVSAAVDTVRKETFVLANHNSDGGSGDCNGEFPMFQTGLGKPVSVKQSSVEKARTLLGHHTSDGEIGDCDGEFPMFQTGLRQPVSVKQSSVEKAHALLENHRSEEGYGAEGPGGQHQLLQTGFGGTIPVNKGSIDHKRTAFQNQKFGEGYGDCSEQFAMFKTGSDQPVSVDLSSIQKAGALENRDNDEEHVDVSIFSTGSGRSVLVNQSSLQKARAAFEICNNDEVNGEVQMFATGLGRPISVNQSSIEKARTVLENHNNDEIPEDVPMLVTGSGRSVSANQSSVHSSRAVLEINNEEKYMKHPMFATGLGGPISVSKSSIHKAQTFLGDYNNVYGDVPMFATGSGPSGQPVLVKKSSLQKASAVLDSNSNDEVQEDFSMFSTGSGRPVLVNQSSINKAWALLENHNNDEDHGRVAMFSTGSGRSVSVNEISITRARAVLEVHSYDEGHEDVSGQLPLFKSGSGQSVSVSKSSIMKAKAFLENDKNDLHQENQCTKKDIFTNLVRTFEKNSKLSLDGISRATTLLGLDENDLAATQLFNHAKNNQCSISLQESQLHPDAFQALQGLSTASGRPIAISDDALYRAGNLLSDLRSRNEIIFNEESSDQEIAPRSLEKDLHVIGGSKIIHGPENEVPHQIGRDFGNEKENTSASKRKPGKKNSATSFKRPRNSRFIAPLNKSVSFAFNGPSTSTKLQKKCQNEHVSTRYPFHLQRKTIGEFFGGPPLHENQENVSTELNKINSKNAKHFVFKNGGLGINQVGSDEFHAMLIQCGALPGKATKQWVTNHYKWIVWKLACYERCYPSIAAGKFLTVPNVLEELKYRYDREVNCGHRSAIKKILDGDVSPASMMVLCICNINYCTNPNLSKLNDKINDSSSQDPIGKSATTSRNAKIELTDGWYSLEASLDALLTKQLLSKKIFIGQKIRILGASLCGWVGPISFLEASGAVSLSLHINGTYRASWDEPLGFCKRIGPPLAFWCVRSSGGTVPLTLVGIKRIYPLLYKERLSNGGPVVRSERMEIKALQVYHQRRSNLAEEVTLKSQEICSDPNLNGTCEGAKILKLIERSAEPDVLMAGMTSEQLKVFSSYQARLQDISRMNLSKKVENALEQAGLGSRDVSPFMKVRVVGLNRKNLPGKGRNKEGLVTIWNPTEKHKMDLMEGGIYRVTGLMPLNYGGDILYLQARGSSSIWKPLSSVQANHFESFFQPRKAVKLSNLGQVALASEFDLAAVVLVVGDAYLLGQQKRQWIFVTDGSGSKLESGRGAGEICDCILAISFYSPVIQDDCSSGLFNKTLEGSIVGFLNLVKRARDQRKNIWVAETTDYSTYYLSTQLSNASHLKEAAMSAERWAKSSRLATDKLREQVLCLVNGEGC